MDQFGQQPEPSQATGMALVRCILGKFLGVVCHCFPPAQVYRKKIIQVVYMHARLTVNGVLQRFLTGRRLSTN